MKLNSFKKSIMKFVKGIRPILDNAKTEKKILFEGAQGYFRCRSTEHILM